MTPGVYNFPDVVRGDSINAKQFTVVIDAVPLDLDPVTIRSTFKGPSMNEVKTIGSGITIIDANAGIFQIDQFILSRAGIYNYDIEFTLSGGSVKTFIEGSIKVLEDFTR